LVGLEEMIMRADLDRPVAGIGDLERHGGAAGVQLDVAALGDDFSRNHSQRIGWWTVTILVPSGKVASTWMSWIIEAIPSITWSAETTCAPASMSSATERPSRAPSTTKSVMRATASGWLSLTPRSSLRRATI